MAIEAVAVFMTKELKDKLKASGTEKLLQR